MTYMNFMGPILNHTSANVTVSARHKSGIRPLSALASPRCHVLPHALHSAICGVARASGGRAEPTQSALAAVVLAASVSVAKVAVCAMHTREMVMAQHGSHDTRTRVMNGIWRTPVSGHGTAWRTSREQTNIACCPRKVDVAIAPREWLEEVHASPDARAL